MHFNRPTLFAVDDLGAALGSAPRRSADPQFQSRPKIPPSLDPLELGMMVVSHQHKEIGGDKRLPLALLQRRRKRRRKHQFEDAAVESRIRKKKKPVIIFLDSEKADIGCTTKAMYCITNEETVKPTSNKGPRDNTVTKRAIVSMQAFLPLVKNRQVDAENHTATTEDATAPFVTLVDQAAKAANTPEDEMQTLQERLAACHVGKPRKNLIDPDSLFADAVDEVLIEDDDSVGSGKSETGAPAKDRVPLWVGEQRETTTHKYILHQNITKAVQTFQPPPVGYKTFDMFHSERQQPPLDVSQFFQLPALAGNMAKLSDFHQLLLQNCEMVKNTEFQNRNKKASPNQLGMRCRLCAVKGIELNHYPSRPNVIHLTYYKVGIKHLAGVDTKQGFVCPNAPNELRSKLEALRPMVTRQTKERGGFSVFQFFKQLVSVCAIVQTRQGIKLNSDVTANELMDALPPVKRRRQQSFEKLSIKQAAGKKTANGSTEPIKGTSIIEVMGKHQNRPTASRKLAERGAVSVRYSEKEGRVHNHTAKETSSEDTIIDEKEVVEESLSTHCFDTSTTTSRLAAVQAADSSQNRERVAKKVADIVVEDLSLNSDDGSFEAMEPAEGAAKKESQQIAIQTTHESSSVEKSDTDFVEVPDSYHESSCKQIRRSSEDEIFMKLKKLGAKERMYQNQAVQDVYACDVSDSSDDEREEFGPKLSSPRKESSRRASIEVMDDESGVEFLDSNIATKADKGMVDKVAQLFSECARIPDVIKVKTRAKRGHKSDTRNNSMSKFLDEATLQESPCEVAEANSFVVPRSPSEEDNQTGVHVEALVTDTSDSEGSTFAYKAESQVGQCERICKDAKMAEEVANFVTQNTASKRGPYSLTKFLNLWKMAESRGLGFTAKDVEKSKDFRRANHNVEKSDSDEQGQAQYGRILPRAMEKVFYQVMELQPDSIFVDLGHGIGNTCLQAAYTIGCHSKGIELVDARYFSSEAFNRCLAKAANIKRERRPHQWNHKAGLIELRHGRLEDPVYHEWLTARVHHVFVNNFADVFGERSAPKKTTITVDSRIAAMFATMKPGSVMVTMHPIDALGLTRDLVLDHRRKHNLKTPHTSLAAFFTLEKIELGPANETVSWSANGTCDHIIWVYKYTRLEQANEHKNSVFLCTNHRCERAREAEAIPATIKGESGLIMNACDCNFEAIRTRGR